MIVEYLIVGIIVFLGAVVFATRNEVQSVDQHVWRNTNEMKNHIRKLEADIIDLNRYIKELKDKIKFLSIDKAF